MARGNSSPHDRASSSSYYVRLVGLFEFFAKWEVLPFDEPAAAEFERLRRGHRRAGVMDLKIAAITLVHGGTLLSRNVRDVEVIAELHVEDWLDDRHEFSSPDQPEA